MLPERMEDEMSHEADRMEEGRKRWALTANQCNALVLRSVVSVSVARVLLAGAIALTSIPFFAQEAPSYLWVLVSCFCFGSALVYWPWVRGHTAYFHHCSVSGELEVDVVPRWRFYLCKHNCRIENYDDRRAVIALSGFYLGTDAPTRIAGQSFSADSVQILNKDMILWSACFSSSNSKTELVLSIRMQTKEGWSWVEISLAELMTISPERRAMRLFLGKEEFAKWEFALKYGEERSRQAWSLGEALIEVEGKIYGTSRFGKSKEAGAIREFIVEEMEKVLGKQDTLCLDLARRQEARSSAKKGGGAKTK